MTDYRDIALKALVPGCQYASQNNEIFWDVEENNGVVCPSQEQIEDKIAELEAAEPMRLLRIERDRRLAETDWVTLKAYSQGVEVPPIWKNYMQALRDLPFVCVNMTDDVPKLDEQGNLINVPWPDVPEQHHMKDY